MTRHLLRLLLVGLGISYGLSASAQTKLSSAQTRLSASAQTKLSGRILDEQRKGVEAAIVLLITSPDSVLVASTLTDSLGHFALSAHKGDFVLCVRNLGYKEAKRSLRLEASEQLGDILLEPEAQALDKVVVTARRSRPLTTATQGKIQIYVAQSYLSDLGSALDVLKHAPGITVSSKGEVSLVYFNGVLSHAVEKAPMLHPSFKSTDEIHEEIVTAREPSEQEWLWGERVRKAIHTLIKEVSGRDIQLLFNRVDVVGDGQGGFYLMEVSLIDAGLYLGAAPEALDNFADAIAQRIFW